MDKFEGVCFGGPHDGQRMVHWSKTKKFLRPMVNGLSLNIENEPVEAIDIGEYRHEDGQWLWWETEAGRSLKKLFCK